VNVTDTTRKRIRELRKRHAWTQEQLAQALNTLGAQTDRAAVAKVEGGLRDLRLEETVLYAVALDVALVHLLIDPDSEEPVTIGPNLTAKPHELRTWIRGHRPLYPPQDPRFFFTAMPKDEFEQLHKMGATE
jgi:transcriptional regulator with XRE-family HTH domain